MQAILVEDLDYDIPRLETGRDVGICLRFSGSMISTEVAATLDIFTIDFQIFSVRLGCQSKERYRVAMDILLECETEERL